MTESLSNDQVTAYFKAYASRCPHCGQPVNVVERHVDCGTCYESCKCPACGERWTNHYGLTDVSLDGETHGPTYYKADFEPQAYAVLIGTFYACKSVLTAGNDDELSKFKRLKRLLAAKF